MIAKVAIDTYVDSVNPNTNYSRSTRIAIAGSTKYGLLYFPLALPVNAVILTASLRLWPRGAWTGDNHIHVERITSTWSESKVCWNNQPTVTTTHAASATITDEGDLTPIDIDVAALIQDVADGTSPWYGLRIRTDDGLVYFYGQGDPLLLSGNTLGAELTVTFTTAPNPPSNLFPDDNSAIDGQYLTVSWGWNNTSRPGQTFSQVQTSDTTDFTSPDFDSGYVANINRSYDLSAANGFAGVADGETVYWRVRVKNDAGVASDWSQTAQFHRNAFGTLTIDSPIGEIHDLSPNVVWHTTGSPQTRWEVELYSHIGSVINLEWTASGTTETEVEIPAGLVLGPNGLELPPPYVPRHVGPPIILYDYIIRLKVWDSLSRVGNSYLEAETTFNFSNNGGAFTIDNLAVAPVEVGSPGVKIEWTADIDDYDFFALVVDGVQVAPRMRTTDAATGEAAPPGMTLFRINYWHSLPRVDHTYEIQGVVTVSEQRWHSIDNAEIIYKPQPVGVWLMPTDIDTVLGVAFGTDLTNDGYNPVMLAGVDGPDFSIGESAAIYSPLDSRISVRIVESVRGYEGSVSGILLSALDRDQFLKS